MDHRNPNQLAMGVLSGNTSLLGALVPTQSISLPIDTSAAFPILQLTTEERITSLEAEIFALRATQKSFVPTIKTRTQ